MPSLSLPDFAALAFFLVAWTAYSYVIAGGRGDRRGLNYLMDEYRVKWMREMADRDMRMVDSGIMVSLQNGTAFFASTSILAFGGALTLLRGADDVVKVFSELSFGLTPTRGLFELKVVGLLIIFGYAFFKFAWAYRLFNFTAILIGATPAKQNSDAAARERMAMRAAAMSSAAGRHFSHGQRAFFFALAYLGWFLGPWLLIAMTAAVVYVMWARQFASDARRALFPPDDTRGIT
jgi:uncharacterized membrane protein